MVDLAERQLNLTPLENGRAAVPLLMAIVSLSFIILVIYQLNPGESAIDTQEKSAVDASIVDASIVDASIVDASIGEDSTGDIGDIGDTAGAPADPHSEQVRARLYQLLGEFNISTVPPDRLAALRVKEAETALMEFLASLSEADAAIVAELLEEEPESIKRHRLLEGLGMIGGDIAATAISTHYESMITSERVTEANRSIIALGQVDNDLSYDLITDYIHDGRPVDRFRFISELGVHSRRKEAVPLLTELLENELGDRTRNKAAQALKRAKHPHSATEIERLLKTETVSYVRQTMIGALGAVADPGSLDALEEIVKNDKDLTTRMSAVKAIGDIGTKRGKVILEAVVKNDTADRIQRDARRQILRLEDRGF